MTAKRVLTFGTFDLLHPGHEYVLSEAAKRGELFVVVARDSNVEHIKGRRPEHTEERRKAVSEVVPGATVFLGDETDYMAPIRSTGPDLIVMGYDQKLPPGITEEDLLCEIERLEALKPEEYKSSIRRRG